MSQTSISSLVVAQNQLKHFGPVLGMNATAAALLAPERPLWKRRIALSIVGAAVSAYTVYPLSLLMLFRFPEHISWLRLFEYQHGCHLHHMDDCTQLALVHAMTFTSLLTFAMLWGHFRNDKKQLLWIGMYVFVFGLAIFKLSVDHLQLYEPPRGIDLTGKVAVVTGANRGIGRAVARSFVQLGAHVVLTCRTTEKCQPVVDLLNRESNGRQGSASGALLTLGDLQSAHELVQELSRDYPAIDYVVCNAGSTPIHNLTLEGLEDGFGGMHLTHMAVVLGLLPSLRTAGEESGSSSRIVMVSSEMAINSAMGIFGPEPLFANNNTTADLRGEITRGDGTLANSLPSYGRAKLCNVLFATELNRRLRQQNWPIVANSVHSGAVATKSSRSSIKRVFRSIPGLPWLVSSIYFPIVWRSAHGGARVVLCAALARQPHAIERGGQYLDGLCHPLLPTMNNPNETKPTSEGYTVRIGLWGSNSLTIIKDPIQALLVADDRWSTPLWDVSMSLIEQSPAREVILHSP